MLIVMLLLAALLAAGFSIGLNSLFRQAGWAGIVYMGPLYEELLKTGLALFFNVSVPGTHLVFGMLEAAVERAWEGRRRLWAGIFGIAAHCSFGLITYFIIKSGFQVFIAVTAATAVHAAWNRMVLKLSGEKDAYRR